MKKTLALILAAAMLFALLTACGSGGKPAGTAPPAQTAAAPTAGPRVRHVEGAWRTRGASTGEEHWETGGGT